MKKQILSFALVAAMVTALAIGCSSTKDASKGADSTKMDSTSTTTPAPAATDTAKTDTTKKDTSKKM
ncbi:coproporphyrinogen III oxidase [Mucilaginibacter sp. KACC 22773]|uniref:coproporphyrinogen III oxidase n=1 Tax=Mucilaginibacter sp. KACC 22773 TaxID=3025671 RepID=UPI002365FFA3|nr:coproporphyrinogen III oxidase [Mucilaginibacter sp. KACC 22773]WDF80572.1 coproporphyrinogen III oxidase [Mucilaginibacter sp. KACC 22773]